MVVLADNCRCERGGEARLHNEAAAVAVDHPRISVLASRRDQREVGAENGDLSLEARVEHALLQQATTLQVDDAKPRFTHQEKETPVSRRDGIAVDRR